MTALRLTYLLERDLQTELIFCGAAVSSEKVFCIILTGREEHNIPQLYDHLKVIVEALVFILSVLFDELRAVVVAAAEPPPALGASLAAWGPRLVGGGLE